MSTFTCLIYEEGSSVPTLSIVLAESEERARLLVLKELSDNKRAVSIEVYEDRLLRWTQRA